MMTRFVAQAAGVVAALVLGAAPALAASPNPYDAFDQTAYLAYLNAPDAGANLTRPPRLRISFGARSYAVVMDTGSTGIVVSADKIPNVDRLPSQGPGRLTYSSSGRVMIGSHFGRRAPLVRVSSAHDQPDSRPPPRSARPPA